MNRMAGITFEIEREGDQYVSLCPDLDIASYGDSVAEARRRLEDAISLYLDVIEADGECERVSRKR